MDSTSYSATAESAETGDYMAPPALLALPADTRTLHHIGRPMGPAALAYLSRIERGGRPQPHRFDLEPDGQKCSTWRLVSCWTVRLLDDRPIVRSLRGERARNGRHADHARHGSMM